MNRQVFLAHLAEILVAEPQELQYDARLDRFKGWDSMGKLQVLSLIDTDVGIPVPLNWLAECHTIGQILALVEQKITQ